MLTLDLEKIPPVLKDRPQWVVWAQEMRDGKPTKVPYQPQNPKRMASSTNPETWGTFEQALSMAQTNGFHGIGYVFSPQDDYAGVDLDKCRDRETGEIEPWAKANIDRLQSYTEKSPSGTGLHILIKGKVPTGGNKKGKVEMYSQGRYFTMTGHHLESTPTTIEARQTELEALHKEVFGAPQAPPKDTGPHPGPALELSDRELIEKACQADEKFSRLWKGDTAGYSSPSEADYALVHKLAFWTNKDPGRIDLLFRQSGLCQDPNRLKKWDRLAATTISKAIANTPEGYIPRKTKQTQKKTVPKLIKNLDIAAIYAQETGLKLLTEPPQVNREGFTQCSVLYKPEDLNRTAFVNIGQGEKRGYYVEMKDGKAVIGGNICQTIAAKGGSGSYMTPKDVYKYLQKKMGQKRRPPRESAERGQAVPNECGHYYAVLKGCHNLVVFGESETKEKPLSNFVAQVTDEVTRDDGAKLTKEFIVTGCAGDLQLPSVCVLTKEFDRLSWVREQWGAVASITPVRNNASHLPNAILAHSRPQGINRQTLYAHTGWRKINGVWRYLHGGGGIGPGEPVAVDLGENLELYRLPAPGGREAAQASLRFLDIAPWEIVAPLWSCTYLAPLSDLLKIDFSLWLYGPTGSLKSTLAALALAHFGNFTRLTLPGSWFSTVNSLEKLTFILKDTLCVIDDFCPPANQREAHAMAERAGRIIYQAGNRSARGRLRPDLTARPNYYPRSLILSTGEVLLPGQRQSATARCLGIEFDPKKSPIDKARLTEAQGEQALYAQAMAAYLGHLAPQLEDTQDEIRVLWTGYRTAFQKSSHHSRIPEIQAWLAVGFELGLRFQVSMGAITPDVSYEMEKQAWQIFEALGEKHSRIIKGQRPTLKFLAVLRELFYQGKIYAEGVTISGPPHHGGTLGWNGTDHAVNADLVGWADESTLYLLPESTFKVVQETIRRQGDFLSLGKNDLLSALAREGFIEPGKGSQKGRNTQVKMIQGDTKRVMVLPRERWDHDEVIDDQK